MGAGRDSLPTAEYPESTPAEILDSLRPTVRDHSSRLSGIIPADCQGSLKIAEVLQLIRDLVELGLREFTLLLVLDDDAPEEKPDQIARALEARPLDGFVNPVREILRNGDCRVLRHTRDGGRPTERLCVRDVAIGTVVTVYRYR